MRPIITPRVMRTVDAETISAGTPLDVLMNRSGEAVARAARRMLGGVYGRTVLVVAGKGNNGADGRVAGRILADEGVRVRVVDAHRLPLRLPASDLIIDAAFGTGFRGEWNPPSARGVPVLAVDIPSGLDALTGRAGPNVWAAHRTVTFVALKPGLLFGDGPELCGEIEVADIGIRVGADSIDAHEVEKSDVATWLPMRPANSHKWNAAVLAVAGSPTMLGAAHMTSRAAMRLGAGIVHLASPGVTSDPALPDEIVRRRLSTTDWSLDVMSDIDRFGCMVIGPGLGRDDHTADQIRRVIAEAPVPLVVDADALDAVSRPTGGARRIIATRTAATVMTPHDGEYALLVGEPPSLDRLAGVRTVAKELGCVCLLKGPTTVVAEPSGETLVVRTGDQRLATAGSGDVLAGMIAALIARGLDSFRAAATAAWIHGRAAALFPHREGLIAPDLTHYIPAAVAEVRRP